MAKPLPTFRGSAPDVWRQLSQQLHGKFIDREGWRHDKLIVRVDRWVVTLDIHAEPRYKHETLFTRFRAAFINPEGFRFNIYHQSAWAGVARMLGMQDISCGVAPIDCKFVIKSNSEQQIKRLMSNDQLRELLASEPDVHLHVRDSGEWFAAEFPQGVDELVLEVEGRVTDLPRLERLYALFAETLHTLSHIGSAYGRDPKLPG